MTARRLRRFLGGSKSSSFRKAPLDTIIEDVPDAASASTQSSEDELTTAHSFDSDPYADVRDQLEARASACKAQYYSQESSKHQGIPIPPLIAYTTYLGYAVFILWGHLRDLCALIFQKGRFLRRQTGLPGDDLSHFAPLLKSWEHFYTRRLYTRVQDAFNRPIASNPGATIDVLERVSDDGQKSMKVLGSLDNLETEQQQIEYAWGEHYVTAHDGSAARRCLNLGSYNYLGFADDWQVTCAKHVKGSLTDFGVSACSSRKEFGTTTLHRQVEQTVAEFLDKPDALCFNMGFNTNATTIPALVGRGDLIISDELNHTSIVNGARSSGAAIRIFRHNDTEHLREILREAIVMGRPRTRRPWSKILVIVEGIYSMEGEYTDLRNIVKISKEYGAYVYLDEAHSIGAMGPTGRGCAEYTGVPTSDIDIMMGTFTKSFGGMGGYVAASKEIISYLRKRCAASTLHNSLSPIVCQQVLAAFEVR